jgi:hypothetical protein
MKGSLTGRSILVVEDEPLIAMAVSQALEESGAEVTTTNTLGTPYFSWSTTDCRPPSWITRSVTVTVPCFTRVSRNGAYPS